MADDTTPVPKKASKQEATPEAQTITLPGGVKIAGAGGSIIIALALIWQQATAMHNEALTRIANVERKVDVIASQLDDVRSTQKDTNADLRELRKDLYRSGISLSPPAGVGTGNGVSLRKSPVDLSLKPGEGEGFPTP